MERYDVIIIGGGITGVFTAYKLIGKNIGVCLVEKELMRNGATTRSGGVVTRMMDALQDRRMASRSRELILEAVGWDEEIVHRGYISIEKLTDAEDDYRKFRSFIPDLKILDEEEIRDLWSFIKLYRGEVGLYTPTDFTIEPDKLIVRMWELIGDNGVHIITSNKMERLILKDNKVYGVELSDNRVMYSEKVVLTAGSWNKIILNKHGINPKIFLIGVPIFRFKIDENDVVGVWDEEKYSYWRPSMEKTWVGGGYDSFPITRPEEGFEKPSKQMLANVINDFKYRFNFRKWEIIDSWSGPISISEDYKPIAEEISEIKDLFIIDGLGGRGLMRGPALAEELAEKIVEEFDEDSSRTK